MSSQRPQELIVYYPVAHAIWGRGILDRWGVLDFAGGIVIHATAGAGSAVAAIFLRPRAGFEQYHGEFPQSNLPLAMTGTSLLWLGLNGFNGGSALTAGPIAVSAVFSTHLAACVSSLVWVVLGWSSSGKSSIILAMNGALAGLAGITPASGYIDTGSTMVVAVVLGLVSYYGIKVVRGRWPLDDSLDVCVVHGLTGVVGAVSIGFVSTTSINPAGADGLFFGGGADLLGKQVTAVTVVVVWSALWTWAILELLQRVLPRGVRTSSDEQAIGLDWRDHRDVAYHDLEVLESKHLRPSDSYGLPDTAKYRRVASQAGGVKS